MRSRLAAFQDAELEQPYSSGNSVDWLNERLRAALDTDVVKMQLNQDGTAVTPSTPEDYAAFIDKGGDQMVGTGEGQSRQEGAGGGNS
jgi:hypothetical protein